MSKVTRLSIDNSPDERAGIWVSRIDRGLSELEKQELGEWLAKSPGNYRAFVEMAELWDQMDAMTLLADLCPRPAEAPRSPGLRRWAVAATVVLAAVVASLLVLNRDSEREFRQVRTSDLTASVLVTEVGEQAAHRLSDGSTLILNTDSEARIDFTEANRFVMLERGEIHISVAHESRPLSVVVGDRVFQALGTEFNIEITDDHSIELLVTAGLVVVGLLEGPIADLPRDAPVELAPSSTLVAEGEAAIVQQVEDTLYEIETNEIRTEDIAIQLSWRNGNIVFTGETLEEAMQEVERYTAVKFVFLDENAKKEEVAGFFKAGDVEGLLAVLRAEFEISYQWIGDHTVELAADGTAE